ncbi:hypothetical protein Btru_072477 [Bulinus truncatus]|nr:hypothetical protein Btru_072477 [Bulinus truncatus]
MLIDISQPHLKFDNGKGKTLKAGQNGTARWGGLTDVPQIQREKKSQKFLGIKLEIDMLPSHRHGRRKRYKTLAYVSNHCSEATQTCCLQDLSTTSVLREMLGLDTDLAGTLADRSNTVNTVSNSVEWFLCLINFVGGHTKLQPKMNLAQNYLELPEGDPQELDPVMIFVATLFAFVVLLLVTFSCLCCSGSSNSSGTNGLYDREDDTVTFADLLSKPPLADPESVFSELSYDMRVSGTQNSWMPLPHDGGNSGGHDYYPAVLPGQDHFDPTRRSSSVKLNNVSEAGSASAGAKKWSSEKHRVNQATRQQREREKEVKFNLQHGTHHADTDMKIIETPETETEQDEPVAIPKSVEADVKAKVLKLTSGIEESGLKIHQQPAKPKTYAFTSAPRCSFSHEVGHIANGSKLPRTSLPRTEENESPKLDNRKLTTTTSHSTSNINNRNSQGCEKKCAVMDLKHPQHLAECHLSKSNSDNVISYKPSERSADASTTSEREHKVDNPVKLKDNDDNSPATSLVNVNTSKGQCDQPVVTSADPRSFHPGVSVDHEGVVLRRSFSQFDSGDHSHGRPDAAIPKCFSLNLKINFHFGSGGGDPGAGSQVSAQCVSAVSTKGQLLLDDSKLDKIEILSNGHNLLVTDAVNGNQVENIKQKMLEDSFAAKMKSCKYLETRQRLSEPDYLSRTGHLPMSRRYSVASSKPKERTGQRSRFLVHDFSKSSNQRKSNLESDQSKKKAEFLDGESDRELQMGCVTESDHESQAARALESSLELQTDCVDESDHNSQMECVTQSDHELQGEGVNESDPVLDTEGDCVQTRHKVSTINTYTDEVSNESKRLTPKLRRSKVILGTSPPKLKILHPSPDNPIDPTQCVRDVSASVSDQKPLHFTAGDDEMHKETTLNKSLNNLRVKKGNDSASDEIWGPREPEAQVNKRTAVVFKHFPEIQPVSPGDRTKPETTASETKQHKPVAMPRKRLPQSKEKDQEQTTIGQDGRPPRSGDKTNSHKTVESKTGSRIPILIVDDDDDDANAPPASSPAKVKSVRKPSGDADENNGSEESDYDNPWDDLDDAVKRASMRYNRRPSRVALGDKNLFLKSAEDLGRLLEEAEMKRKLRLEASHTELISPEDDKEETMIIPFTRFSPYRHTVKGIVNPHISSSQSSENILGDTPLSPLMDTMRYEGLRDKSNRHVDPRRPQSMTAKLKSEIPVLGRKRYK